MSEDVCFHFHMAFLSVGMVFQGDRDDDCVSAAGFHAGNHHGAFRPWLGVLAELLYPSIYPHTERRIRQEFFGNLALVTLDFEFAQPGCGDTSSAFMYCRTSLAIGLAPVRID